LKLANTVFRPRFSPLSDPIPDLTLTMRLFPKFSAPEWRRLGAASLSACVVLALSLLFAQWGAQGLAARQQQQLLASAAHGIGRSIDHVFLEVLPAVSSDAPLLTRPCDSVSAALRDQVTRLPYLSAIHLIERGQIYCSSVSRFTPRDGIALLADVPDASGIGTARLAGLFADRPLFTVRGPQTHDRQVVALIDSAYFTDLLAAQQSRSYAGVSAQIGAIALTSGGAGTASSAPAHPNFIRAAEPGLPRLAVEIEPSARYTAFLAGAQYPRLALLGIVLAALVFFLVYWYCEPDRRAAHRLRRAIDERAFVPYYQPLMDARLGRCVGVEVLARWRTPDGQILSPAAFIDLAERSALVIPLTRQLMERVAIDLRCGALPPGCRVAINLSSRHLCDGAIVEDLREIFHDLLPHYRLDVEVTERAVIGDFVRAQTVLDQIRQLGFEIAVDDFGTDYSSLKYLQQFRFDVLKIDRSFVAGLPDDATSLAIVSALCTLSAKLGMQVIAEGVETEAQVAILLAQGVSLLQGYYYSPPLAFNTLLAWLAQPERPAGDTAGP
jgi:sensor c-di-GMP phosphodiesterase-like protein